MAFRPTIAVVINNEIADIGYYRNWMTEDLFIEAMGLAVIYRDCRTVEAFREKVFGTQKVSYIVEPEVFENTQENLRWLEDCSEMPITVDLSRGAIYEGRSGVEDELISAKPDIDEMLIPASPDEEFYWDLLSKHRISFDKIHMDNVMEIFMEDEELRSHLSVKTAKHMREFFMERTGESYDEAGTDN